MNNLYKKIKVSIRALFIKYFIERISLRQKIYIAKRISFLLEAGVSLPDSLSLIAGQMKKRGGALSRMAIDVSRGQSITDIVDKSGVFGSLALPMIKIGEESGVLGQSFDALSDELEKRLLLQQKIIGAIIYPACITFGMFVLVIVLMVVVFPKMLSVFTSLHVALPLSTRILIYLSNSLRNFGLFFGIFFIFVIILSITVYRKSNKFHFWFDNTIMRIPFISKLFRAYALASVSNVIALLMLNNSSLVVALSVAAETSTNQSYAYALRKVMSDVSGGVSIKYVLVKFPHLFPNEYCDILSIGEQTGRLSESFAYAHTLYTRDLDMLTKSLASSIEPILMIFIGLAIGVVAFSVITPMYSITAHLHG